MLSGINVDFSIKGDYTKLNPPIFYEIMNLHNTILIPKNLLSNFSINIGDQILIMDQTTNKKYTQTVVIDCGDINLGYQNYYYFYIANGLKIKNGHSYSIVLNDITIPLSLTMNMQSSAKLIIGLLILSDNYKYEFNLKENIILNIDTKQYKLSIIDILNKFNYYVANKNTTIVNILDNKNFNNIQAINTNSIYTNKFIRPLYRQNFPLGSISIDIDGVSDNIEYQIYLNNSGYLVNSKKITIQNLQSGQYSIKIIDRNGPVLITKLNNNSWNKDYFDINIPQIQPNIIDKYNIAQLPQFYEKTQPKPGFGNLMINLDSTTPIQITGPNNFIYNSNTGYVVLNDMISGDYIIKQQNLIKTARVHTNDTTYVHHI